MPPAMIAAIATIAAAATTTGVTLYEAANAPSQPKIPTSPTTTPLTSSQNASTTAAASQQLPTLQSMTGGSVSPEYSSQFAGTNSGNANNPQATGDIQQAINQFFGLTAPGSSGLTTAPGGTSGGGGVMDLLAGANKGQTPGASSSGGNPLDLVSSMLNGGDFKGLVG